MTVIGHPVTDRQPYFDLSPDMTCLFNYSVFRPLYKAYTMMYARPNISELLAAQASIRSADRPEGWVFLPPVLSTESADAS